MEGLVRKLELTEINGFAVLETNWMAKNYLSKAKLFKIPSEPEAIPFTIKALELGL